MSENLVAEEPTRLVVNVPQYSLFLPKGGSLKIVPLDSEEKIKAATDGVKLEVFAQSEMVHAAIEDVFQKQLPLSKRRTPFAVGEKFLLSELVVQPPTSKLAFLPGQEPMPTIMVHLYQVEVTSVE
jgi:hypothetical protein